MLVYQQPLTSRRLKDSALKQSVLRLYYLSGVGLPLIRH